MTTENNKIISEFLGNKPSNNGLYTINGKTTRPSELIYHSDWNWLMKVVEKILSLSIELDTMDKYYDIIDRIPNIEAVYKECINFIKEYNSIKSLISES